MAIANVLLCLLRWCLLFSSRPLVQKQGAYFFRGYMYGFHAPRPMLPKKLEKLKIVFDRVCQEMDIADIQNNRRERDRLATSI
jgi:hypothetical protein